MPNVRNKRNAFQIKSIISKAYDEAQDLSYA